MTTDNAFSDARTGNNLRDLDRHYDDPFQIRELLIELNAWDLENDCFVPESLFETQEQGPTTP